MLLDVELCAAAAVVAGTGAAAAPKQLVFNVHKCVN